MSNDEDPRYNAAKKRVGELKEFYEHLFAFIVVNAFLFGLNLFISPDFLWSAIVVFAWGIGLVFHAWETYGISKDWEERKIEELMGETHKRKNNEDYFDLTNS